MKIYPIRTGSVWVKKAQRQGVGSGVARRARMFLDTEWSEELPILAWLIDHPEGPFVVDTGDTVYFLAGDTSYDEELLRRRSVDGVSGDDRTAVQTMDRIIALAARRPTVYLPSHDPKSVERLVQTQILKERVHVAV